MNELKMLIWLSQLGLSTALPPLICGAIGIGLHRDKGYGKWSVWAGLILGLYLAVSNFCTSVKLMQRMADSKTPEPADVSFSDHG